MKIAHFLILLLISGCNQTNKGGYEYQKLEVKGDSTFYFYPIRNLISKRDSIYSAAFESRFFKSFDEPNISLRPLDKELYRFVYTGFSQPPVILSLSDGKLTVKKAAKNFEVFVTNRSGLSDIELRRLNFLSRRYPIDTISINNPRLKHYVDSMITAFPQLKSSKYYISLLEKNFVRNKFFTYNTEIILLDSKTYQEIKIAIDSSSFWHSPYKIECEHPPMDGHSFYLEANTSERYNFVITHACENDTSKLTKACQKLVDIAHLGNEIHLIWTSTNDSNATHF